MPIRIGSAATTRVTQPTYEKLKTQLAALDKKVSAKSKELVAHTPPQLEHSGDARCVSWRSGSRGRYQCVGRPRLTARRQSSGSSPRSSATETSTASNG